MMLWYFVEWMQVSATANNLHIIPEISQEEKPQVAEDVQKVGNATLSGSTLERYNEIAKKYQKEGDVAKSFQTGIMGWETPIQYVVYIMKFLSQLGLLIWGIMILYAGYLYATTIFGYGDPNQAKTAIKNAIIWVIVVIASYAIFRGLTSLFL